MKRRSQIRSIAAASALVAALVLPAAAAAEYYVPPANSAANQYTESFPGAGGESGGKRKGATPGDALGAGNAKKLESKGPAGKAAAEVAAETAPPQLVTADSGSSATGAGQTGGGEPAGQGGGSATSGSGDDSGSTETTGSKDVSQAGGNGNAAPTGTGQPQGSSGFGQVLGQATGVGDGDLGLWLPLAIVLTLIGSVAYWVRMRHAPQPGHRA
ncbi:MAG TPA: hypothetical protein VFY75_02390 [Solirubrobacterales bacterium]|nr:hypothetical protein [Solirubrobacterales bacterium]